MPRRMSFALTEAQLLDGSKDVTRRLGWATLRAGSALTAVRKGMGLAKGERQHVLAELEVVSVRSERLDTLDAVECMREGFPQMTPARFVAFFCAANKVQAGRHGHADRVPHHAAGGLMVMCYRDRPRCQTDKCHGYAIVLCSFPITRRGKPACCNRHICRTCAKNIGAGKAYCPPHGREWDKGAAERRVLEEFFPGYQKAARR